MGIGLGVIMMSVVKANEDLILKLFQQLLESWSEGKSRRQGFMKQSYAPKAKIQ